jgi:hypothetical protein
MDNDKLRPSKSKWDKRLILGYSMMVCADACIPMKQRASINPKMSLFQHRLEDLPAQQTKR